MEPSLIFEGIVFNELDMEGNFISHYSRLAMFPNNRNNFRERGSSGIWDDETNKRLRHSIAMIEEDDRKEEEQEKKKE